MEKVYKFLLKMDEIAIEKFKIKIPNYSVKFDLKSERTVGMFYFKKDGIGLRFHGELLNEVGFKKYKEVIIHEYAHLINFVINKGSVMPHGKEWKQIMNLLGVEKPRATTISFINELLTEAKCKCSKHYLTKSKVQKINNGIKLRCYNCGKKIKLNHKEVE